MKRLNTKIDLLIENASSLSPLEEAENEQQAIREGGMVTLDTPSAEDSEDASGVIGESMHSAAALSGPDVWKPFAIERYAEPVEKPVEKPMESTLQTSIKTLTRKLPGPIQKFFGVAPEPEVVQKIPETSLGRLFHWFTGKKSSNNPTSETVVPRKKRTVKRLIWDGFFQLFLIFLRWMVQRTVRNIKKNL